MKTKNFYIKALSVWALSFLLPMGGWGQTISNDYQNSEVQHKDAKWYTMRNNISQAAKDMDTFDDENPRFKNPYTGTSIQSAHTYYDTLYVRKGSEVELTLPVVSASYSPGGNLSARSYQRWYNFVTESTLSYTEGSGRNRRTYDLLEPAQNSYRFANGYVGGRSVNNTDLGRATFTYPTDADYQTYASNGFKNGSADNNYYIIACDASGYIDFTKNFNSGNGGSFLDGGFWEPTLGLRVIYYIIGVDDRGGADETEGWKNGMGRLENPEYRGGDGDGKKFLEEYDITFPCDHLGNQTDELVALSKFANGYRIDGDDNTNLTVTISSPNNVFRLLSGGNHNGASGGNESTSITLSGNNRAIFFRPDSANSREPWSVSDGQTATIVVTKTVGRTTYNIAKFNLTFKKDTRLLTQHELDRIDRHRESGDVINRNESWYSNAYATRTPNYLDGNENYKLLTSRTFDYDPNVANMFGQSSHWYYPFPLEWGYSSYAFFDGSTTADFDGSTDNNSAYNRQPFAEWGTYAITNNYVGYGDIVKNSVKRPTNEGLGGRNAEGYFLYVDASDKPGTIVTLPFTENLCPGSELFVSAWVKSADEDVDNSENSAMLFTIYGVTADDERVPLYRQSTGQITTTTFLGTGDGSEYTNANGYGSQQNDWYQIYFSFLNKDERTDEFVSYELKVDNNCGSTAGGDFYLDEIKVYIAQPTATVMQKDYACTGERTLLRASLDWYQLCERLGSDPDETDSSLDPEGIDFCFIDEAKYNILIGNNENPTVEQIADAIRQSIVEIGVGETEDPENPGYDQTIASLHWNLNFESNTEYVPDQNNIAYYNPKNEGGRYYFYRSGSAAEENRQLVVDFYSNMIPNTRYIMFILDRKNEGTNTIEDFADFMNDPCAIKSTFYVTAQTLIKINGEVAEPDGDHCLGQTFNFTAQLRVPQLDESGNVVRDPETGEEQYETIDTDVYFDWFFGSQQEFVAANGTGGESLQSALTSLRDIRAYRDVESLDGVVPVAAEPGVHDGFTQEQIDLIQYYLDQPGPEGGLNHKLVLHRSSLDIAILENGMELVISPITTVRPSDSELTEAQWERICWEYVPLTLTASGEAPKLYAGFNRTNYPEGVNPALRIGLYQIKDAAYTDGQSGRRVKISLRGAEYTSDNVEELGLIESAGDVDYTQLYLIDTDDPNYTGLVHVEDFSQYTYPIGKILSLKAQEYNTSSDYVDEAEVQFYLDEQTLADGKKFTFAPREGYTYTFAINFAEHGRAVNNSCWGSFPMTMKVVPENLVWSGGENDNWNNDTMWKRAKAADLKITDGSYTDDDEAAGFVPMLFSNVVMPTDSKARLYMAGFREGGSSWAGTDAGLRPDGMGDPTENIQYDLMVYDKDPEGTNNMTTQRFRVNICHDIHFMQGAQMLHAEQLIYTKAWMDMAVPTKKWTLVSTPLQDVYAGDWYTTTSGTQADEQYFTDITFDSNKNSRLDPAVYQRSWDENATIVENQTDSTNVGFNTSTPAWSAAYNDASVPYTAGAGFSIKAANASGGTAGSLVFRFPKADTGYDVSTGTIDRTNGGKLFISGLLDRSNPLALVRNDDVSLTLDASQDGKYMIVGNPYMAPLDLQAFFAGNSGLLTGAYWTETENGPGVGGTDGNSWLTPDASSVIPPYGAFFVERKADATGDNTVKFTADMQKFVSDAGSGTETTAFTITADNETGRSGAVLAYAGGAVNGYEAAEDVQLMRNLLGNNANELSVYTVAGDKAVSVNRVKDLQQIPLGVFAADGDVTTLTFTGVEALLEPSLYDAETGTDTPLTEGMTISVDGSSHGRYFIRAKGAGSGSDGSTGVTDVTGGGNDVSVYSVEPCQVVVSSGAELMEVGVYSVGGSLLKRESVGGGSTSCKLYGVDSGVAVVRVVTADGTFTRKITVR